MTTLPVDRPSEARTVRAVERLVTDALPRGWTLRSSAKKASRSRHVDAEWAIVAPDGASAQFAVEAKQSLLAKQLDDVLAQLRPSDGRPLVAAPYLGPTLRGLLTDRQVSFADTTGNLRLISDRPGLFVERHGATKDPWPSDHTLHSLRGRAAGRALRALVDFRPPFGVRDLSKRAGVPLGSLSRTLDLIDREGLVTRDARGAVVGLDWEATIRRWVRDYDFSKVNRAVYYLDPRGLGPLVAKLAGLKSNYAVTGPVAAQHFAPIAPARQATLYVEDTADIAWQLKLRPADVGANVVLAEPFDPVVFERSTVTDGIRCVAATQLAADLLTGPGRDPSEGDELLSWMRLDEDAWRA